MKKIAFPLIALASIVLINACKKDSTTEPEEEVPVSSQEVLGNLSQNVIQATYNDLALKSEQLYTAVNKFNTASTDQNLSDCKTLWKSTRQAWERSEGFLFGPVATDNIDPRIDTWPVNYVDLDSVLSSGATFTAAYVDALEDALKGFHPIEYLLFGKDGAKAAAQVTAREKEYLLALTDNLKKLTQAAALSWNPSTAGNYSDEFTKAGQGSKTYATQFAAYEEVVNAMAGICDEVANGKIEEPLAAEDPSLEESPFAQNSIKDFTDNIISVLNIYSGTYAMDGYGVEDVVKSTNLSLDNKIKTAATEAIAALGKVTDPFGKAIFSQKQQIKTAQEKINALKDLIEGDLMTYIKTQVK